MSEHKLLMRNSTHVGRQLRLTMLRLVVAIVSMIMHIYDSCYILPCVHLSGVLSIKCEISVCGPFVAPHHHAIRRTFVGGRSWAISDCTTGCGVPTEDQHEGRRTSGKGGVGS